MFILYFYYHTYFDGTKYDKKDKKCTVLAIVFVVISLISKSYSLNNNLEIDLLEMDIKESTDDTLFIDFHYCPLVKAWQKAGCTDEEIAKLCDIAMCGDHGIGECYGSILELPKCIAKGHDICALRYKKVKK